MIYQNPIVMATTLPAINSPTAGKSIHDVPVRGLTMSPTDKVSTGRKRSKVGPPKVIVVRQMLNKKELELQRRRLASRDKLEPLTEWQTNELDTPLTCLQDLLFFFSGISSTYTL